MSEHPLLDSLLGPGKPCDSPPPGPNRAQRRAANRAPRKDTRMDTANGHGTPAPPEVVEQPADLNAMPIGGLAGTADSPIATFVMPVPARNGSPAGVLLRIETVVGAFLVPLNADQAKATAEGMLAAVQQVTSGLIIPTMPL